MKLLNIIIRILLIILLLCLCVVAIYYVYMLITLGGIALDEIQQLIR